MCRRLLKRQAWRCRINWRLALCWRFLKCRAANVTRKIFFCSFCCNFLWIWRVLQEGNILFKVGQFLSLLLSLSLALFLFCPHPKCKHLWTHSLRFLLLCLKKKMNHHILCKKFLLIVYFLAHLHCMTSVQEEEDWFIRSNGYQGECTVQKLSVTRRHDIRPLSSDIIIRQSSLWPLIWLSLSSFGISHNHCANFLDCHQTCISHYCSLIRYIGHSFAIKAVLMPVWKWKLLLLKKINVFAMSPEETKWHENRVHNWIDSISKSLLNCSRLFLVNRVSLQDATSAKDLTHFRAKGVFFFSSFVI